MISPSSRWGFSLSAKAKFRFLVFSSKTCGPCLAMHRAGTIEKVVEKHSGLSVQTLWVSDDQGESPSLGSPKNKDGIDYKGNDKLSDVYEVKVVPTIVLEAKGVGEIARMDGAGTFKQIEGLYLEAIQFAERSGRTPWNK